MVFFQANKRLELHETTNTFNVIKTYSANGYMLDLPVEIINNDLGKYYSRLI